MAHTVCLPSPSLVFLVSHTTVAAPRVSDLHGLLRRIATSSVYCNHVLPSALTVSGRIGTTVRRSTVRTTPESDDDGARYSARSGHCRVGCSWRGATVDSAGTARSVGADGWAPLERQMLDGVDVE
jgi:hypothetical protein